MVDKSVGFTWSGSWFLDAPRFRPSDRLARLPPKYGHAHAILGALRPLLSLLISHELHTPKGLVFQLAARAVATHHDRLVGVAAKAVLADPLAVLLVVADGVQSWKRPFMHRTPVDTTRLVSQVRPMVECEAIELEPEDDSFVVVQEPLTLSVGSPVP